MKTVIFVLLALAIAVATAAPGYGGVVGKCPPRDGPNPVYLLDMVNRHIFYECSNGKPIRQDCSPGLVFRSDAKVCAFPSWTCRPCGQIDKNPVEPYNPIFLRDGCNVGVYYHCFPNQTLTLYCEYPKMYNPYVQECRDNDMKL